MAAPKVKFRKSPRKQTTPISVSHITTIDDFKKIAKNCEVIEASANGLLICIPRESLIPAQLRNNLSLDVLVGERVFLRLEDMNLEVSGSIVRSKLLGKAGFLLAVDYSDDAPEYWRECLMDLLPRPGELD